MAFVTTGHCHSRLRSPADAAEVAGVVSACAQLHVPWVARGAGTSHSGGALPHPGSLVIALTRLRRILSVNLEDDEITAEPGAPLASLADAAGRPTPSPTTRYLRWAAP